jgi:LmbE family N-acetylglucosaminyl deacetylase
MSENLIIVAHPDDEILFGYSQLMHGNWHVLSMTGENRNTRYELEQVCSVLGLTYSIFTHCDDWDTIFDPDEVIPEIKDVLSMGFEKVLTHNNNGEYGHTQHQSLSRIVRDLVPTNLFEFGHPGPILQFNVLKRKLDILSMYKIHGDLGVWDWYDQNDPTNTMMYYVVHEGFRRIK